MNVFRYLLGKISDIKDLDRDDALLGKVVLDVHRLHSESETAFLPLDQIQPIHPIDREEALETMKQRAGVIAEHREEIKEEGRISQEFLYRFLPSVSNIKVADLGDGHYVSFEGNGRLGAVREALGPNEDLPVEVEMYRFDDKARAKLRRRINRLRRSNGSEVS